MAKLSSGGPPEFLLWHFYGFFLAFEENTLSSPLTNLRKLPFSVGCQWQPMYHQEMANDHLAQITQNQGHVSANRPVPGIQNNRTIQQTDDNELPQTDHNV